MRKPFAQLNRVQRCRSHEINGFAAVTMAAIGDLAGPQRQCQRRAMALVIHGATGAHHDHFVAARGGKKRGIASLCIGGGEATAIAIELV